MKIGHLSDWQAFVDRIADDAESALVKLGYERDELPARGMFMQVSDTHANFVAGKGDRERERAAWSVLILRQKIAEQIARFDDTPDECAARIAALTWKLHMVAGGLYPDALRPAFLSREQSDRGARGAQKRWQKGAEVSDIIQELARQKDWFGDPVPPGDLWPQLYSAMEDAQLNPCERDNRYSYDGGSINYEAFRKQVQRKRK